MDSSQGYQEVEPPCIPIDTTKQDELEHLLTKDCDIKIRHGFIRKVFAIVSIQLLITGSFIALFFHYKPIAEYFDKNVWILYLSLYVLYPIYIVSICRGLLLVVTLLLAFVPYLSQKYPVNIIMLSIYTLIMSTCVGYIACHYKSEIVIYAIAIAFGIFVFLIIFAIQTKYDFTGWGPYILVIALGLFIFGILAIVFRTRALEVIYCGIGVLVCCIYIVYDTQLIVGGRKYEYPIDAYVMAALNLYADLINLFLYILSLMGGNNN